MFRRSENRDCFSRLHNQRVHVNYKRNHIFNIPSILYTYQEHPITPAIRTLLRSESPYLAAYPNSTIAQSMIITMTGLNQEGSVVQHVQHIRETLYFVYAALHLLVERELAEEVERLGQEWHQRIHDSWDVAKNRKDARFHEDNGWIQYQDGPVVKGIIAQFDRESLEISRKSDVLWAEKEMLWISSLGVRHRELPGLSAYIEPEVAESSSPSISSPIELRIAELIETNDNSSVTGIEGQSSNL
jgi:hypothetical protein